MVTMCLVCARFCGLQLLGLEQIRKIAQLGKIGIGVVAQTFLCIHPCSWPRPRLPRSL